MKRQATVAALVVSSVTLSGCAAEVGSKSASEDAAMTAETDGTSSVDGAGNANGSQGDDVEDNPGDSEHPEGEHSRAGAGLRGRPAPREMRIPGHYRHRENLILLIQISSYSIHVRKFRRTGWRKLV